jgi:hypothetical protein
MLLVSEKTRKTNPQSKRGLTIIEMLLASVIVVIAIFSVAVALSDSHHGFKAMYNRIYSEVVTDSHVVRRMFDSVVRKSNCHECILDYNGRWVEVHYYDGPGSMVPDRYTCFNWDDTHLYVEYGRILEDGVKETISYRTVCGNVSNCTFRQTGRSLQMILTLSNGSQTMTTVTSAVMHN